jgi:hypothetical protein
LYFSFNDQSYEQTDGVLVGSLLVHVIANFFVEEFGGSSEWNSQFHHVDEMFMIWPHGSE